MQTLMVAAAGCCVGLVILSSVLARHGVRRPVAFAASCIGNGTVNLIPSLGMLAASPFLVNIIPAPHWVLLLLTFLLCAAVSACNSLYFVPTLVNRTTPYWDFDSACADASEPYDVFISYKAEDAHIARQLAEWLIAVGRRPWFDEFVIPRVQPEQLLSSLNSGPSQCTLGIVMANEHYAQSHWTRVELQSLVDTLQHADLFNLYSGEWPTPFPSEHQPLGHELLAVSNRARYEGSLEPVCSWLRGRLAIDDSEGTVGIQVEDNWFSLGENWQITLGQWKHLETQLPGQVIRHFENTVVTERIDCFELTMSTFSVHVNIICGKAPETWRREFTSGPFVDKRDLQRHIKDITDTHLAEKTHASHFEAAHLIYVDAEPASPQFGFTYWDGVWTRRFSVVLATAGGEPQELALVFAVNRTFRDLCSVSGHIDTLVKSIRHKS